MTFGDVSAYIFHIAGHVGFKGVEFLWCEPNLVFCIGLGEVGNEDHFARIGESYSLSMLRHGRVRLGAEMERCHG